MNEVLVSKIMTRKVVTVSKNSSIAKVMMLMDSKGIKEVPVVSDEKYVGTVIYYDFISDTQANPNEKIDKFIKKVPVLSPKDTIDKTIRIMVDSGISGLPVIDESHVVGIVSDYDIFKLLINNHIFDNFKVSNVIIKRFPILRPEDTIEKAANLAAINKVDNIPVLDNFGKMIGEVMIHDILKYIYSQKAGKKGKKDAYKGEQTEMKVVDIMRRDSSPTVITLNLRKALENLISKKAKAAVVVDVDGRPIGILSRIKILSLLRGKNIGDQVKIEISGDFTFDSIMLLKSEIDRREKMFSEVAKFTEIRFYIKRVRGQLTSKYEMSANAFGKRRFSIKATDVGEENVIREVMEKLDSIVERMK
ncbi:MAG: CBS domain-containing protein [Candidatus Acidifodinimicrobium sp.]